MSRVENSAKNTFWSVFLALVSALIGFVTRKIFIMALSDTYLGISGLYTDILAMFSFAEMGFGSAITFSLYKPIAQSDWAKIQALLGFYRRVYNFIIAFISIFGFAVLPFLQYLVKDPGSVQLSQLRLYYMFFLVNSLLSYWGAYRESYLNAMQKGYETSYIKTAFLLISAVVQSVILLATHNYVLYLVAMLVCTGAQRFVIIKHIGRRHPEVRVHAGVRLEKEERDTIFSKVKALVLHKVAAISINQTDSMIVSGFVGISIWGHVTNYTLLRNIIYGMLASVETNVVPSMGNLMALEGAENQQHTFRVYSAFNFWLYGFSVCALITLSTPFISLMFGSDLLLDELTVWLLFLAVLIGGLTVPVNLVRTASGLYENDRFLSVVQSVVNLVCSILFVKLMGLPGVFLGTITCNLVLLAFRPAIVFKALYGVVPWAYYRDTVGYIVMTTAAAGMMRLISGWVMPAGFGWGNFFLLTALTAVIPNLLFWLVYGRNPYFIEFFGIIRNFLLDKLKREPR